MRTFLCARFDNNFLIFLPCQVNQLDEINTTDVYEQDKNPIKPQNYLNSPISDSNVSPVFFRSINPYDIINSLLINKLRRYMAEILPKSKMWKSLQTDRQTDGRTELR